MQSVYGLEEQIVRYRVLQRIQQLLAVLSVVVLISIALLVARLAGASIPVLDRWIPQTFVSAAFAKQVILISGHAGYDSGAVCTDTAGQVLVTEAEVNAAVAERAAQLLRRAGADVLILTEFDPRLQGLQADVLLSIHADSCIEASGYKAAHHTNSAIPAIEARLVACIDQHYPRVTGLAHHPNTITHDMTNYHAFRQIDPQTPAAIIELGFLGGDQTLLVERPDTAAQGVAESLLCFLQEESEPTNGLEETTYLPRF